MSALIKKYFTYLFAVIMLIVGEIYMLYPLIQDLYGKFKIQQEKKEKTLQLKQQRDIIVKNNEEEKKSKAKEEELLKSEEDKVIFKPDFPSNTASDALSQMIEDIADFAKYSHLKVRSLAYKDNPENDIMVKNVGDSNYVCQVTMSLIGTYVDLQTFLKELYKYPYILTLSKIKLSPYEKDKSILLSDIVLNIYGSK